MVQNECPSPTIRPHKIPKKLPVYTKIMSIKNGHFKVWAVYEKRILHTVKMSPRIICVLIEYF